MCGRAAQTQNAVYAAANSLGVPTNERATAGSNDNNDNSSPEKKAASSSAARDTNKTPSHPSQSSESAAEEGSSSATKYEWRDNFNMSPGMDAMVFYKEENDLDVGSCGSQIRMDRKVWGLVSRGGTAAHPLPTGMNLHFQNLMFNARSDTLFQKPTFARLAAGLKRTCLIALDGFFEWKATFGRGRKQPYFVYRKKNSDVAERPYLLMAGLWTSVPTGRKDDPVLDTFTIITTEACKPLEWLHSRMPLCIWDEKLALQWLLDPSERVHRALEEAARNTAPGLLAWHEVSTDMSSTKFRSADAIKALPKYKTVKSFFAPASSKKEGDTAASSIEERKKAATSTAEKASASSSNTATSASSSPKKRAPPAASKKQSDSKRAKVATPSKKGTIESFFSPKKKTSEEK